MQQSRPSFPSRGPMLKSRGKFILTLGSLLFVAVVSNIVMIIIMSSANLPLYFKLQSPFGYLQLFCLFAGPPLGIIAWRMAQTDIKKIGAGTISASASGITRLGRLLGASGTFLSFITALMGLFILFTSVRTAALKDAMTEHLVTLGSNAYQYRHRPAPLRGGGGSYSGYVIPDRLSSDEYGTYTAIVAHRDTLLLKAETVLDMSGTITMAIDSTGRSVGQVKFGGMFDF